MSLDFFKLFQDLGLSPTETKVYLASLKLGPTSIQIIAENAKLSRTATYDTVSALQGRGLMSTFERGKKKFFSVEKPERALAYFRSHVRELEEKIETFVRSMDEIKMMSGGDRPTVRFFEGQEALHALFHDLESVNPGELLELANVDLAYDQLDPKILTEARNILRSPSLKIKMLYHGDLRNPQQNGEYCKLLDEFGMFAGEIWIYGNRVAFVEFFGKPVTVIIESKTCSDMARVLFNAAWSVCIAQNPVYKI